MQVPAFRGYVWASEEGSNEERLYARFVNAESPYRECIVGVENADITDYEIRWTRPFGSPVLRLRAGVDGVSADELLVICRQWECRTPARRALRASW